MIISEYIKENLCKEINENSYEDVFKRISEDLKSNNFIKNEEKLFKLLIERESQGSTYVGFNTSIPHIKCKELKEFVVLIYKTENPIRYNGNDVIEIVIFVGGPAEQVGMHLKILARIARMIKETSVVEKLKKASPQNFKSIFFEEEKKVL